MSEFEADEFVALFGEDREGGLFSELSKIAIGTEEAEAEISGAFDNFKDEFKQYEHKFNMPEFNEEDHWEIVKNTDAGEFKIDMTEVSNDLSEGKFEESMDKMGFDMNSEEAKDWVKNQTESFEKSFKGEINKGYNESKEFSDDLGLKDPTSEEDFKEQCKQKGVDIDIKEQEYDDMRKEVQEKGVSKSEKLKNFFGKENWDFLKKILGVVLVGAIILASLSLYDFVKNIQNAMNGCFLTDGNVNCKIEALTCDDEQATALKNTQLCEICTDLDGDCKGKWVPLKLDACSCDSKGKTKFPGDYNPSALTGDNTCDGKNPKCPSKNVKKYDDSDIACKDTNGCIVRKEACNSIINKCSDLCSTNNIRVLEGQVISCRQVGFWQAFGKTVGDVFDLNNITRVLIKLLIKICIILGIVIVGWWIIKSFMSKI